MATPETLVGIDFGGGIDERVDAKRVLPTKLLELENARLAKGKRISKRYGMRRVGDFRITPGSATHETGISLSSLGPLAIVRQSRTAQPNRLLAQRSISGVNAQASDLGVDSQNFRVEIARLATSTGSQDMTLVDSASYLDLTCYAYETTTSAGGKIVAFTIVNNQTGALFLPARVYNSPCVRPRVIQVGGTFVYGFVNTTTNNIEFRAFTPFVDAIFPTAAASTVTLVNVANPCWDWSLIGGSDLCFCYISSTATTIRYGKVSQSGVASSSGNFVTSATPNCVAMCDQPAVLANDNARILWHDSTAGLSVRYFDSAGMTTGFLFGGANRVIDSTTTVVENIAGISGAESSNFTCVVAQYTASRTIDRFTVVRMIIDGTTITVAGTKTQRAIGLASKLFVLSQRVYGLGVHSSPLQSQFFMFEWTRVGPGSTGLPVARFLFGECGGLTGAPHLPAISLLSLLGQYAVALLRVERVFVQNNAFATLRTLGEARLVNTLPGANMQVECADTMITAHGFLGMFDGQSGLVEHGFFMGPELLTTVAATSGGALADGTYQHVSFYEWTDGRGRLHRSSVSPPVSTVVSGGGGAGKITVTVPNLRVTLKDNQSNSFRQAAPRVVVCRTEANGKAFYRVNGTPADTSSVLNDTTIVIDTLSNATLITREIAYTFGGELDNYTPNSSQAICQSPTRVFVADDSAVFFSKEVQPGVAVSFAGEFSVQFPSEDGPIRALAYMDGRVYAFKRNQVWSFTGDGPDATGAGASFTTPERLKTDGGCVSQFGLVCVPQGIIVRTVNGFYLLGRDESWTYIGGEVRDYNALACTAAVIYPLRKEVRFAMGSVQLIYNYEFTDDEGRGQWSVTTFGAGSLVSTSINPATLLSDDGDTDKELIYAISSSNSGFYVEDTAFFTDETLGNYALRIGTAWIMTSQIQGFQRTKRLYVLGHWSGDSTSVITVRIAYDFEDFTDTYSILASQVATGPLGTLQFEVKLARQKCQAIRVQILDTASGAGCDFTALTLLVGLKEGGNRLPAERRA